MLDTVVSRRTASSVEGKSETPLRQRFTHVLNSSTFIGVCRIGPNIGQEATVGMTISRKAWRRGGQGKQQ